MSDDGFISPAEAGRRLGVSRQRVRQMVQEGKLIAVPLAGRPLIPLASFEALLRIRENRGNAPKMPLGERLAGKTGGNYQPPLTEGGF